MPAGRPPIYSEEILDKARDYLHHLPKDEVVHSKEGLALHLGISRETIYDWCRQEDKKEFSDIVEQIYAKQGKELVNKGLEGKFQASIAKVMLSKHEYREGTDITSQGEKIVVLPPELIAKNATDTSTEPNS